MTKSEASYRRLSQELARLIDSDLPKEVVERHAEASLRNLMDALAATQLAYMTGAFRGDTITNYKAEVL